MPDRSDRATCSGKPRLLVMASTYPRWVNDVEPGFVHALCLRLASSHEVHVVCPHAPGALTDEVLDDVHVHRFRYAPESLETLVQNGGILNNLKFHPWKWLLIPLFLITQSWKTWQLARRLRPVCLHAHWIIPQGLVAAGVGLFLRQPAPYVLTSHGGDLFSLRGQLFEWLKRAIVRRAAAVTVVSQTMVAEAVRLGASPTRVHVLPMGADFDRLFTPGPAENRQPGEILFVGRLVEKKGLRFLIEAMPRILEQIPDARLVIVGRGPEATALHKLVLDRGLSGHIAFLGALPQAELPGLYRRASVFVAPFIVAGSGDREGLGLVTVEALACGCPVVVGDTPVLDDLFDDCDAHLRVDPRNNLELADRVVDILRAPDSALAHASDLRHRLMTRLGWDTVAENYRQLLISCSTGVRPCR